VRYPAVHRLEFAIEKVYTSVNICDEDTKG